MSFQSFGQKLQISEEKVWFSFLHLDRIWIRNLRKYKRLSLESRDIYGSSLKLILSMFGFVTIHLFLP